MSRVAHISTTRKRSRRGQKTPEATITSHDAPDFSFDSDSENNPINQQKKRVASLDDFHRKKKLKETVPEENIDEECDIVDEHCSAISISKNKRIILNAEQQKDRRLKLKQYLQLFVDISKTYLQKIDKGSQRTSRESGSRVNAASNKCNPNALKYFQGTLRPYQVDGVVWLSTLFENSINGILGDDMGLGKTIQVIALFCYLYERKIPGPFLIVVPLSTLGNWVSEFKKFAPKIPCTTFEFNWTKTEQTRFINKKYELDGKLVKPVIICTYQAPIQSNCYLRDYEWQYIVVDEGQRLKNPNSKLSLELRGFLTKNKLLLTGTPLQNEIGELWALFGFLMPELFENMEDFSTLFDLEDLRDTKKLLETEAETKMISKIHKVLTLFMLRREKKLVLHDIVPKKEMIIYCPLTPVQKYLYRAILADDTDALNMLKSTKLTDELPGTPREKRRCAAK
nr:PREDICTED: lymphoid-specific helicase-like [Tribolium castaneum]XP_008199830.1 PREDICTED: lymphoid-specific helicase-like [Tribolium castaneum]XP_015836742.1 PREDICTED: lymphoid-specific helicase-like [Tribolium castaneum]|eukprot:XP_008199829.1 PREDICTED: lymphoid-specific helicase-like [Tribolium castaneum]